MKSLFIDWGYKDTYFYVEDKENNLIKKSRKFEDNALNIAEKAIDIIVKNRIKEVKIDTSAFGLSIADNLEFELRKNNLDDVKVLRYRTVGL